MCFSKIEEMKRSSNEGCKVVRIFASANQLDDDAEALSTMTRESKHNQLRARSRRYPKFKIRGIYLGTGVVDTS